MLFFDIGANIGSWALANCFLADSIISVEASPSTYASLVSTVNHNSKIVPLHFAVSPVSTPTTTFYHCVKANTLSTLDKSWLTSPESRFFGYGNDIIESQVPTISIDKLILLYGIPDLLKVDVEGAECTVLKSLTQKVPLVCFEWAAEWRTQNLECVAYLASIGFTQFAVQVEDAYTYRPNEFPYTLDTIQEYINIVISKQDWGMIWAC